MSSVLIGMFDTQNAAEQARERLAAAGYDVTYTPTSGDAAPVSPAERAEADTRREEGTISGFFLSMFSSNDEAAERDRCTNTYSEAFRRGLHGLSVSVDDDADIERAERILNEAGAFDIDERSESWRNLGAEGSESAGTDWSPAPAPAGLGANPADTSRDLKQAGIASSAMTNSLEAGSTRKLQGVEEPLQVGKRAVARSGVRIFTRMTELPATETVRLREEIADGQRRTVDRPATEADFAAFKEGSIELRQMSEEATVTNTARVTGEVEIGKSSTEREKLIRDTVRKTTVDVEQIGKGGTSAGPGRSTGPNDTEGALRRDPLSTRDDAGRDLLVDEVAAHPVATSVGAVAGGMAAGAAAGSAAGPVGTAVAATVGAVAVGLAGKEVADGIEPKRPTSRKSKIV